MRARTVSKQQQQHTHPFERCRLPVSLVRRTWRSLSVMSVLSRQEAVLQSASGGQSGLLLSASRKGEKEPVSAARSGTCPHSRVSPHGDSFSGVPHTLPVPDIRIPKGHFQEPHRLQWIRVTVLFIVRRDDSRGTLCRAFW